jgi:hypothetical protein
MPKVWLKCSVTKASNDDRIVTILTATGMPAAFFAHADDVVEDAQGAHVHVVYCGKRDEFVLVAVRADETNLASTSFYLVAEADVMFTDTHDDATASLLPTRITQPTRSEMRANYSVARRRYKELREVLEDEGGDATLLDELWWALEPAIDPFIRWEVIAEEELETEHPDAHRRQ